MQVESIHFYPLKSALGISAEAARVAQRGFEYDRRWMLVDGDGDFITQREHPELTRVATSLRDDELRLSRSGARDIEVSRGGGGGSTEVVIWGESCVAEWVDQEADDWFSELLGVDCRLVYMPDHSRRRVDEDGDAIVSFADAYPFLLISRASLDDLNERLDEPVPMNRFRPNIVVEGTDPYAEDGWERIRIGEVEFRVAEPCKRCVVTTTDQETGERGEEPLRTLAGYRRYDGGVRFGMNLVHEGLGIVEVGQQVEALA